ncbi:MAG: hypothetical protein MZV63_17210 [Marinilabiliales bacterium]|nr:hypothetical protein [Marinilabiliales bacterium]
MEGPAELIVDRYSKVKGYENIFALGDISLMTEDKYPNGHPQVAQVAIQQAKLLSANLKRMLSNKSAEEFRYRGFRDNGNNW